jgi:hypothetical protein
MDQCDDLHVFSISGSSPAGKLVEPHSQEGGNNSNCTYAAIDLGSFNMHVELLVVLVVVITISLVVGKERFVRCHRGHDALGIGVIGATETMYQLE